MRMLTARALIATALVGASAATLPSASAAAAASRGFADSPADAGYVGLHPRPVAYTVKAHQRLSVALKGLPSSDVAGIAVGLTVAAHGAGSVTIWSAPTRPSAVTAAFASGTTVASTVVAPGRLSLLNSSSHTVKVTLVAKGYFPSAARAFASGAPGWFVPTPAKKAVSVRLGAHATSTYNALLGAPPRVAAVVLALAATATKTGQLKSFAFHSAYKTHAALALAAGKHTQSLEVVQPSGASHLVGLSNLSAGPASVTGSSVGYVQPFHAATQAQYVRAATGPGTRAVTVTWQPPLDLGGLPITSYLVHVYPNGPALPDDGSVTTVTGLSAVVRVAGGRDLWFGVSGVTAFGVGSERTTDIPVRALPGAPPGAPRNVVATSVGVGQVTVGWSPPLPDGGQPVTAYTVTAPGVSPVTVAAPGTSLTLPWTPGLAGFFSVAAINDDGTSLAAKAAVVVALGVPDVGVATRVSAPLTPGSASTTQVLIGERPSVSNGGRFVAFSSAASDLVVGDTNNARDVFVRDLVMGRTTRVSVASDGAQGNGESYDASISADGRYVVFDSVATNLAPSPGSGSPRVYRHDVQTGETVLVSQSTGGQAAEGERPTVSADGNRVAFASSDAAVVTGDNNSVDDVFVRDIGAGTTVRVSLSDTGAELDDFSEGPAISPDGNVVAFSSWATNVVAGFSPYAEQMYVRNLSSGTTIAVSRGFDGMTGNDDSYSAALSTDGRYVAFESGAGNLVTDDSGGGLDFFVRDVQSGTTTRVDVTNGGGQTTGADAWTPVSLSGDGHRVAFQLPEVALVPAATNGREGIFVRDLTAGTTREVSVADDGTRPAAGSAGAALSPDGHFAAFAAGFGSAANPVDGITTPGIYLRDIG